jgi:hypothetical protein
VAAKKPSVAVGQLPASSKRPCSRLSASSWASSSVRCRPRARQPSASGRGTPATRPVSRAAATPIAQNNTYKWLARPRQPRPTPA